MSALDRLTDRERRVLRLLANGHSVKSAASTEGITENAANELLRSARRKLDVGSSREAARLLAGSEEKPQENRDENSVLPASPSDARSGAGINKGIVAMGFVVLAAGAAWLLTTQGGSSAGQPQAAVPKGSQAMPEEGPTLPPTAPVGAPRVIGTVPAEGAVVAPGPFRVAVTFDRAMAPESFAFVRSGEGAYPDCTGRPQLSPDGRTYSLECEAKVAGRYVMHFNQPPYLGFVDAVTSVPAQEARLEFTVSGEAAVGAAKVVRTSPASGAEIALGPFTLSVTFDRAVMPRSVSYVRTDEGAFPECTSSPQLSADGRTYTLECVAREPGTYVVYFNRPPYMAFRDAANGAPAEPVRLAFTVRAD